MLRKRIPLAQRLPSRLQLGAAIVEARRAAGVDQETLGRRLDLQSRAINRWERNETAPNDRHRRALIREIHLLNPQAGLTLQAAISAQTGKAYKVVSEPIAADPSISHAQNDNSKSQGPTLVPALKTTEPAQPVLDVLEFVVLKMADEMDVAPRRVRRALSRLLERLREANVTLDTLQCELAQVLARD